MYRSLVMGTLVAGLLADGCAVPRSVVPPGEDPSELTAAIAQRGQENGPYKTVHVPASWAENVTYGCAAVGVACVVVPVYVAYGIATFVETPRSGGFLHPR